MLGRSGWEPAKATVTARRESSKFAMAGGSTTGARSGQCRYDYVVDVVPSGADAPFTTTLTTPMFTGHWRTLHVGHVVTVLHRPGTQEVKWDRSEKSTSRRYAHMAAEAFLTHSSDEQFDAALHHPDGAMDPKVAELIEFEERAQKEESGGGEG